MFAHLQEADYTPRYGFDSCEDDFYHWVLRHLGENYMKLAASTLSGYSFRLCLFASFANYSAFV
jgi:hypothetical protein